MRTYLDWNATTPPHREVVEAVSRAMLEAWGNSSSLHEEGRVARDLAQGARQALAGWTRTRAIEWILTSGGTESIHAAIHGCVAARPGKRRIVTSAGEHSSTIGVLAGLEHQGFEIVRIPTREDGTWDDEAAIVACDPQVTALASLIWANNETGAVSGAGTVASVLRERKVPLHLDAVQCFGKIEVDLSRVPAGFVSMSAHKFQGPKGIGALFVRQGTPWSRWIQGGNQERSRRGGTVNVPGAAGLARAVGLASDRGSMDPRVRDELERRLVEAVPGLFVVAHRAERLPNTSCVVIPGCDSSTLLDRLDARGFAVSSGSACTTGSAEPSHVLLAMGLRPEEAHAAIRISLGPDPDPSGLDRFTAAIREEAASVRSLSNPSTLSE